MPFDLYKRAKFFLLPADIVFCNYALLEAMSFGVVPIVSRVEGTSRIVKEGIDGLVVPNTLDGLKIGLRRSLSMGDEWKNMSTAAYMKIKHAFSIEDWAKKLLALYHTIGEL